MRVLGGAWLKDVLIIAVLFLPLSACEQYEIGQAKTQLVTLHDQCNAKYPMAIGAFVEHAQCLNDAEDATIGKYYPAPDILQALHAQRLVLGQELDDRQLTEPEAQLKYSQFLSSEMNVLQQRQYANAQIQAQRADAYAAVAGVQQQQEEIDQQQQQTIYQTQMNAINATRPAAITTNCNTFGNQTNCTSQ